MKPTELKVAVCQMAPVWLNREETLLKVNTQIVDAAQEGAGLAVFGEAIVPGYPFWVEWTDGAKFNSPLQKQWYSLYQSQAVDIRGGHLSDIQKTAKKHGIAVYLGVIEKTRERSGHSLYCSLVFIDAVGEIKSVHRKLMPTYEERLVWAPGDGNGLKVHEIGPFVAGGLNCWENWIPMARAALHGQGSTMHVAVWPGSRRLTGEITRFIAMESRSFVVSASGFFTRGMVPDSVPEADRLRQAIPEMPADGGSCIAAPDGNWILEPQTGREGIFCAVLDATDVAAERQNFDYSGHYGRPDVLSLHLNSERQKPVNFN